MHRITTGVHLHFAHHVRGHRGQCISIHGHTWKFELTIGAKELDQQGFVLDFDDLQEELLNRCHLLLDHSLALGEKSYAETIEKLVSLGNDLVATRRETVGNRGERQPGLTGELGGARNDWPGDMKVAVFPFTPTSERLAEWFYNVASQELNDGRVNVQAARVFETLHPIEAVAEYGLS